jgi:3-hydroxyacyl-CoA dehydrogenase
MSALPSVALIGAGTIGTAWAVVFARAGCNVRVWDGDAGALERFPARVAAVFEALEGSAIAGLPGGAARISTHADLARAVGDVDWVQEQVKEDLAIKQEVLPRVEAAMRPDAILATSTSGLSEATLAEAYRVMEAVGQKPIRVHGEISGFAMNRIQAAMLNEMVALVRDGVISPEDADTTLTHGFGLRWAVIGPFAGVDLNALGGIRQYMELFGYILNDVAKDRGAAQALTAAAVDKLEAGLRAQLPLTELPARQKRRDRAIAALRGHLEKAGRP